MAFGYWRAILHCMLLRPDTTGSHLFFTHEERIVMLKKVSFADPEQPIVSELRLQFFPHFRMLIPKIIAVAPAAFKLRFCPGVADLYHIPTASCNVGLHLEEGISVIVDDASHHCRISASHRVTTYDEVRCVPFHHEIEHMVVISI